MTTVTAKHLTRGPLTDKTNVSRMKSRRPKNKAEGTKEINASVNNIEKSRRFKKKNTPLCNQAVDENAYHIGTEEKKITKHTGVENKENRIGSSIKRNETNTLAPLNKTELFVKISRLPNNKGKIENTTIKNKNRIKNILENENIIISATKTKSASKNLGQTVTHLLNQNKETRVVDKPVNNKLASISKKKNTFCTKELYVKISRLPKKTYARQSSRTRRKSIFLNETVYQIDESTDQLIKNHSEYITNQNKDGTDNIKLLKNQQLEKSIIVTNANNTGCSKELFVKITQLSDNNIRVNKVIEEQHENNLEIPIIRGTTLKIVGQMEVTNNKQLKQDGVVTNTKNAKSTKELFIKITRSADNPGIEKPQENSLLIPSIREKAGKIAEKVKKIENDAIVTNTNNREVIKELFDKSIHISDNNEWINEKSGLENEIKIKETENTQLKKDVVVTSENNNKVNNGIEKQQKNGGKPPKNVNLKLNPPEEKESHNLRKLEPKNYIEDSIINTSNNEMLDKLQSKPVQLNLQRKNDVPIYRKVFLEKPVNNNKPEDLYEFIDSSPKSKKVNKRPHRSSIVFDKNTHEILQKIKEKEAKARRKVGRKKKVLKPVQKKSYENIVKDIVSIVGEKINNKNKAKFLTKEKSDEKPYFKHKSILGQKAFSSKLQGQRKVPSNDSHNQVIQVNNFNDEMSIIVHHPAEVPLTQVTTVPQRLNTLKNLKNITARRVGNEEQTRENNIKIDNRLNKENMITSRNDVINKPHLDTFDKLKELVNDIEPIPSPVPLDSISVGSNSDQSMLENDIDSCFGFEDDDTLPQISTPKKGSIKIIENVTLRKANQVLDSPVDFNVRRPNANSTVIHIGVSNRASSPWRPNWINVRHNPHFVSVKSNALPRIDQDLVMDHTLVEGFESLCSNSWKKESEKPVRKAPVQQSILEFVGSTIEKENEPHDLLQGSLFDYEDFHSPVKKMGKEKENERIERAKRNLLGNKVNIVSSTPNQRRVLGDVSNSTDEPRIIENDTYFGFNETPRKRTPEKHKNKEQFQKENIENYNEAKPSRFDLSVLKSYSAKNRKKKKAALSKEQAVPVPEESISLMEVSDEGQREEDYNLFEDPEEMLANVSPVHGMGKKHRRKRLDSSCDSEVDEAEKKRKRHKRTKREIEEERWIEEFNQECEKTDQYELELE